MSLLGCTTWTLGILLVSCVSRLLATLSLYFLLFCSWLSLLELADLACVWIECFAQSAHLAFF